MNGVWYKDRTRSIYRTRILGAETNELLELLEEEVLEDILNQVKTLKNSKKIEKNKKQGARKKSNRQNVKEKK